MLFHPRNIWIFFHELISQSFNLSTKRYYLTRHKFSKHNWILLISNDTSRKLHIVFITFNIFQTYNFLRFPNSKSKIRKRTSLESKFELERIRIPKADLDFSKASVLKPVQSILLNLNIIFILLKLLDCVHSESSNWMKKSFKRCSNLVKASSQFL